MFRTLLFYVLASVAASQAVNVCAWTNTIACSGSSFCCNNLGANACCMNVPQGFGVSIAYNGLPGPVSAGQAWQSETHLHPTIPALAACLRIRTVRAASASRAPAPDGNRHVFALHPNIETSTFNK